jgi:hypothetical protein
MAQVATSLGLHAATQTPRNTSVRRELRLRLTRRNRRRVAIAGSLGHAFTPLHGLMGGLSMGVAVVGKMVLTGRVLGISGACKYASAVSLPRTNR